MIGSELIDYIKKNNLQDNDIDEIKRYIVRDLVKNYQTIEDYAIENNIGAMSAWAQTRLGRLDYIILDKVCFVKIKKVDTSGTKK